MNRGGPTEYEIYGDFLVTKNEKERTCGIYSRDKKLLLIVEDGHLMAELRELEKELQKGTG